MNPKAHEILDTMQKRQPQDYWAAPQRQAELLGHVGQLLVLLAEEQEKASAKLEQQTTRLIEHTVELGRLTRGVLWFTIVLAVFALIQIFIMVYEICAKAG